MSEEIIRITIDYVLDEVKKTNIDSFDGLCFYFSQNIKSYLEEQGIDSIMYNIRDLTNVNFDHYFLIAYGFLLIYLIVNFYLEMESLDFLVTSHLMF